MGRAPCCDKASVKRGPWSPEEDVVLRSFMEKHSTGGNWIALPQKAGLNRCGKSCRLRWLNYLRPDIRHGGFTEEEDNAICSLYKKLGSRWSIIAAHLRGRTDNDVKNYWNTKLKKKLIMSSNKDAVKNPSATPPPALLHAVAVKSESKNNTTADPISQLYSPPLSSNHLSSMINDQDGSVSSSTITADDGGSGSSSSRAGEEDILLSEFDLGFLSELLGGYGDDEKLGEIPPPLHWTASELRYS